MFNFHDIQAIIHTAAFVERAIDTEINNMVDEAARIIIAQKIERLFAHITYFHRSALIAYLVTHRNIYRAGKYGLSIADYLIILNDSDILRLLKMNGFNFNTINYLHETPLEVLLKWNGVFNNSIKESILFLIRACNIKITSRITQVAKDFYPRDNEDLLPEENLYYFIRDLFLEQENNKKFFPKLYF